MFEIFVDGSANLPKHYLENIQVLPCGYTVDGVSVEYKGNLDSFDAHAYYEDLKAGKQVKTSLVNTHTFLTWFRPVLEQGKDIIYIAMSSNISGTYQAARIAAEELEEDFPELGIHIVDSRGCGLGIGLLAIRGREYREAGKSFAETSDLLDADVPHLCQYFTVDDLNFLKNTGRVSGATAMIGTVLNIKPILYGTADGYIVSSAKVRGRKKALEAIAQTFAEKVLEPGKHLIGISHGDCPEEAQMLADKVRAIAPDAQILLCEHEPFSGAHVGPGMLALFFYGKER